MCGAELGYGDANARYGVGSLVNTFLPARLGDAVRFGLFSRALPSGGMNPFCRALFTHALQGRISEKPAASPAPPAGTLVTP